jgi:amidohydrolase
MASNDGFEVRIRGRGGHGARPDLAASPLPVMARLIQEFATMKREDRVVSVCVARAGEKNNIIPGEGSIGGTCRALNNVCREQTRDEIREVADRVCVGMGVTADVSFVAGCPPVVTDEGLYRMFQDAGASFGDRVKLATWPEPSMGSEDFSFYLEYGPGLIFRLGMGEDAPNLHTPEFNFRDEALAPGMAMMTALAMRVCGGGDPS